MFDSKEAAKKVKITVEVGSDNYDNLKTYEFDCFTQDQVDAIKKFLYEVGYIGVRNIRVVEG